MSKVDDIELEISRRVELARQQEAEANELDDDTTIITNIEEQKKREKKVRDDEVAGLQKQIKQLQTQITIRDNRIAELIERFTELSKLPCQKCGINFDRERGLLLCEDCLRQKLTVDFKGVVKGE